MTDQEYGDPGIAWGEADAANDDGQAVVDAERADGEAWAAEIAGAVRRLDAQIHAAQEAARAATATLKELTGRLYDIELAEGSRGDSVLSGLACALRAFSGAREAVASRLKEITDAERDAELTRLRTENASLRARLEGTCPGGC